MIKTKHTARCSFIFLFFLSGVVHAQTVVSGEYIVKLKNEQGQGSQKASSLMSKMGSSLETLSENPEVALVRIKTNNPAAVQFLKNHPDVEYVEPNYVLSIEPQQNVDALASAPQPTDTYTQNDALVKVKDSWDMAKAYNQADRTIVAVIDTGVKTSHGLFQDSNGQWQNTAEVNGVNGVDDDGNGYIDDKYGWNFNANNANPNDDNGHGTHVAGIIIGLGMDVFANPVRESRIRIMPLKFLNSSGSGSTSKAIDAIMYAVNNGAKVINNSWGGSTYSRALHEAYTYAYEHNVVIVSAAGNSSANLDTTPTYPAALDTPSNITVAATDDWDDLANFSNYSSSAGLAHVAAPGVGIWSAAIGNGCSYPGCYISMSGTSMAAPFIAGVVAMAIREAPLLTAYQIKGVVLSSVDTFAGLQSKVMTGGRINAEKVIDNAIKSANTTPWSPSYTPSYKVEARSVASESSSPQGGCGTVKTISPEGFNDFGLGQALVLSLVLLPFVVLQVVKRQSLRKDEKINFKEKRRFVRYDFNEKIHVTVGHKVFDLSSSTLSLGGLAFSGPLNLEKGEKIKIKLDHIENEIEGEIVWNSSSQQYGVKFSDISDQIKNQLKMITKSLSPSAC